MEKYLITYKKYKENRSSEIWVARDTNSIFYFPRENNIFFLKERNVPKYLLLQNILSKI